MRDWTKHLAGLGLSIMAGSLIVSILVARSAGTSDEYGTALFFGAIAVLVADGVTKRYAEDQRRAAQVARFVFSLVAFMMGLVGVVLIAQPETRSAGQETSGSWTLLLLWAAFTIGPHIQKIGYRGRDLFLLLIPFFPFYIIPKFYWRISHLPNTPWDPASKVGTGRAASPRWPPVSGSVLPPIPAVPPSSPSTPGLAYRPGQRGDEHYPGRPDISIDSPPSGNHTPVSGDDPSEPPPKSRRPRYVMAVAAGLVLIAAAATFAITQGEGHADAGPSDAAPSEPTVTSAPTSECDTAERRLERHYDSATKELDRVSSLFEHAVGRREKADILREGASEFFVIDVEMQSLSVPPELVTAKDLLAAAVDEYQNSLDQFALVWEDQGGSAEDATSSWQRGSQALDATRAELNGSPC